MFVQARRAHDHLWILFFCDFRKSLVGFPNSIVIRMTVPLCRNEVDPSIAGRENGGTLHRVRLVSLLVALVVLSAISWSDSCAAAPDDEQLYDIHIPTSNAAEALNRLAEQTGAILLFPYGPAEARQANEVIGRYTLAEALDRLLDGSGLSSRVSDKRVIQISLAETDAESRGEVAMAKREGSQVGGSSFGEKITALLTSVFVASGASAQVDGEQSGDLEEVIVTGSRVARSGFDTPTPLTLVNAEAIENTGFTNIDDVLLRLPQVSVGLGAQNAFANAEAGAAFVNLRGLGTNRSLVVVNGRRRVSGSASQSAADLNMIPAAMIERVELITGGASAVYGADAVTGVVNLITKKNLDGLEVRFGGGISDESDTERYSASLVAGSTLPDDRGYINFGASYASNAELRVNQRDFANFCMQTAVNPANTGPDDGIFDNITIRGTVTPILSANGQFEIGGIAYTFDPEARPFMNEQDLHAFASIGTDGRCITADQTLIRPEQDVLSLRGDFEYQLFDGVNVFVEGDYTNTNTVDAERWQFDLIGSIYPNGLVLFRENPLLPPSVTALMDAAGQTSLVYNGTYYNHGQLSRFHDRNTYTAVAGLQGVVWDEWDWSVFYQSGRYTDNITQVNTRKMQNFLNAVDVISDPVTGEPVCRNGEPDCVPIQIIGGGPLTPAQRKYAWYDKLSSVRNTQDIVGMQLAGRFLELPAGSVGAAFGTEYRQESIRLREDGLFLVGGAFPAPIGFEPMDAEFDVTEVYGELVIPILSGGFLAQQLDFEVAGRYSDYSSIGGTTAWKLGINWQPTDAIRVRSTLSSSVRAPNLNELYGPVDESIGFTDDVDPCRPEGISANPQRMANCVALGMPVGYSPDVGQGVFAIFSGGNPELTEETADTLTAGLVWTPQFLSNLSLSIDYWSMDIEDAVGRLSAIQVLNRCVDSDSINNIFCAQITRGPNFFVDALNTRDLNIGFLKAAGIDLAGDYAHELADGSSIRVNLLATYLGEHDRLIDATDPSSLDLGLGEVENPEWRLILDLGFRRGRFEGILHTRYIDSVVDDAQFSQEFLDNNEIPSRTYNDLVLRYATSDNIEFNFVVNNVFDVKPPGNNSQVYNGRGRGASYEAVGRYFDFGVNFRF